MIINEMQIGPYEIDLSCYRHEDQTAFYLLSDLALKQVIQYAESALRKKQNGTAEGKFRISREFGPWAGKRWDKPWIGKIVRWEIGKFPIYEFGRFLGGFGDAGEAEIQAKSGDIIVSGQKNWNGYFHGREKLIWHVLPDGKIEKITEAQARKIFNKIETLE
jgi:hypothetical protein